MKKTIFKPIAIIGIFTISSIFGCTSSNETETADNTVTDVPVVEEPVTVTENEPMANTGPNAYADLFDNVDEAENYDILALIRMEEDLSTFVELVEMAEMEAAFQVQDQFTLFVPVNQAFEEMPQEELQKLRDPQNRQELVKFINHHFIPTEIPAIQFASNQVIATHGEEEIEVTTEAQGNNVFVGGAYVIKSDIDASNGIIHVVDGIVQPSEMPAITIE